MSEDTKPSTTGALVVGFLLVLMCWGLLIGFFVSIEIAPEEEVEEVADTLAWFVIGGLVGCVAATLWLANLVNRAITGKSL